MNTTTNIPRETIEIARLYLVPGGIEYNRQRAHRTLGGPKLKHALAYLDAIEQAMDSLGVEDGERAEFLNNAIRMLRKYA